MKRRKRSLARPVRFEGLESRQLFAVVFGPPGQTDSGAGPAMQMGPLVATDDDLPFDIRFNFGPEIRQVPAALQTMQAAAEIWESYIADPVTVIIDVDLASVGENTLGQAFIETGLMDYPAVRELLVEDAVHEFTVDASGQASLPDRGDRTTSPALVDDLDDHIVQFLPGNDQLQFNIPQGTTYQLQDANSPTSGNVNVPISGATAAGGLLSVNRATMKGLGALTPDDPSYLEPDGRIELSNELVGGQGTPTFFRLDFVQDGIITAEQFDGLSVAVHEIGHILGFVSSLDFFDASIAPTPMDLFRFPDGLDRFDPQKDDDAANPFEQFQSFTRELRPNVQASTDFGDVYWTDVAEPAVKVPMAEIFGGQQTSHWREFGEGVVQGIMGPTLSPGVAESLTSIDLRMFDLIGWDIVSPGLTQVDVTGLYAVPDGVTPSPGTSIDPRSNPLDMFDVDGNGVVSPRDALLVLNELRRMNAEGESDTIASTDDSGMNTDANRDGRTSAMDALAIINHIRRQRMNPSPDEIDEVFSDRDRVEATWVGGAVIQLS
ncbi:MAG: NF038122 family metalloprotease [Planctomycetota bacterium]